MNATLCSIFLLCQDLKASVDFYQQLGFVLRRSSARTAVFELGSGPQLHLHAQLSAAEEQEFQVAWQPGSSGIVLSFRVDDLDGLLALAQPEAVLVTPRVAPWGTRLAMLIDPDGYRLEFQAGAAA